MLKFLIMVFRISARCQSHGIITVDSALKHVIVEQKMDIVEDNEQNRKDFNIKKKVLPLNLRQLNLTVRSAKIYAPLLPECRNTCRSSAEITVIKLWQAGLKIIITKGTCKISFSHYIELYIHKKSCQV